MSSPPDNFVIFLAAVRRRVIFRTVADRIGFCILTIAASVIALLISAMLKLIPASIIPFVIIAISIASLIIAMSRRWPTHAMAAATADHQLHLDDLLTTTLNLQTVPFDDLSNVVTAIANSRCRNLSISAIAIPHMGARAWAGILFVAAAAIALAIVPLHGGSVQSSDAAASVLASSIDSEKSSAFAANSQQSQPPAHPSPTDPSSDDESKIVSPESPNAGSSMASSQNQSTGTTAISQSGVGSASSLAPQRQNTMTTDGSTSPNQLGDTASGGGSPTDDHHNGNDTSAQSTGATSGSAIPAWQSAGWPAARAAARTAIETGSVPANYRDLVRDYFSGDSRN